MKILFDECAYALLCDPGPGDALRFFNGFCEYLNARNMFGIIFMLPEAWKKCETIVSHCTNCGRGIKSVVFDSIYHLNQALVNVKSEFIFRAFEAKYFLPGPKVFPKEITCGVSASIEAVDRYENGRYMKSKLSNHLSVSTESESKTRKALVFLRFMDIVPERNTSPVLLRCVIEELDRYGVDYVFAGSPMPKDFMQVEKPSLYPNGEYPGYYEQICEYSKYRFAVGMNSGALDLAAASGIPILRIGAFHHSLKHLGKNYNDFLNCEKTVNLLSTSETDLTNITDGKIRKAFRCLMQDSNKFVLNIE